MFSSASPRLKAIADIIINERVINQYQYIFLEENLNVYTIFLSEALIFSIGFWCLGAKIIFCQISTPENVVEPSSINWYPQFKLSDLVTYVSFDESFYRNIVSFILV